MQRCLLLAVILACALGSLSAAWLQEGFEGDACPPNGWILRNGPTDSAPQTPVELVRDERYEGFQALQLGSEDTVPHGDLYLITPMMEPTPYSENGKFIKFWYYCKPSLPVKFRIGWSSTDNEIASFSWAKKAFITKGYWWQEFSLEKIPSNARFIALHYLAENKGPIRLDEISGPSLETEPLIFDPEPDTFQNCYLWQPATMLVEIERYKNIWSEIDFWLYSITLDGPECFELVEMPELPMLLKHAASVYVKIVYTAPDTETHTATLNINGGVASLDISGTATQLEAWGDICAYPDDLPITELGCVRSTQGLHNDYTAEMFTGLTADPLYLSGNDWVGRLELPFYGALDLVLFNSESAVAKKQQIGVFLVKDIPSREHPAPLIAQTGAWNQPWQISGVLAGPGTYYVIVDNCPPPEYAAFKLWWLFKSADEPPNPAVLLWPQPDTGKLDTGGVVLKWTSGGGLVRGYKFYLGTNYPPSNLANGEDLGLVTEKEIQRITATSDTTIYWRVVPYNENGEAPDCEVWSFVLAGSP